MLRAAHCADRRSRGRPRRVRAGARLALRSRGCWTRAGPRAVASARRTARAADVGDRAGLGRRRPVGGPRANGGVRRRHCARAIATRDDGITLTTDALRAQVRLAPFGIDVAATRGGRLDHVLRRSADLRVRRRRSAARASCTAMARDAHDQYFGLGDKTGPLDKHGRRLRTLQLDALGYNGETSDPLYKHWPFFLGRRRDSGVCYGVYYDTLSEATFDFGQEFDNYHGFYRSTDIADGDLDFYVIAGPDLRGALARFVRLVGGTALPPRWTLGFANTAMGLVDAPDAQAQLAGFLARAQARAHSAVGVSLRLRLHEPRQASLRVHLEPRQVSRSEGASTGAFQAAGVKLVANLKPCLLDDHPAFAEVRRARRIRRRRRRRALPRPVLGRLGRASRLHASGRHRVVAARPRDADPRLRHRRRVERQQRVRDLGRGRPLARLRHADSDRALAAAAGAADDARERRGAGRAHAGRARLHDHARGLAGYRALRADVERRQHDELAHAALEPADGADDGPVGHVQHRPRHRRLRRAHARRRAARPLDAGVRAESALHHELVEGRRQRQHAVAASRGDRA